MIKRVGEAVRLDQNYTRRPGAYAIILRGDQILLTHQSVPAPDLQLPGGGIDPEEQTLPALHREVMEETGYRIKVERRLGAFRRFTYMPEYDLWAEKVCHVYLATPGRQIGPPTEVHHMPVWMPALEAFGELNNPGDRLILGRLLGM